MKKNAIFPGSFDPFTLGHYDVVMRGLEIFDEIIIAVGVNQSKKTLFSLADRIEMIEKSFAANPRITVEAYDSLTVDFANELNVKNILRGVRTVADFEYERTIADANKHLSGIETVMLFADSKYAYISSSLVRDLHTHGRDISEFLPHKP